MKAKTAPTSPKYDVENIYQAQGAAEFERPRRLQHVGQMIAISLFFGLIAGLGGTIGVRTLSEHYPGWRVWSVLGWSTQPKTEREVIIRDSESADRSDVIRQQIYERVRTELASIYATSEPDPAGPIVDRISQGNAFRGTAGIVTEDGILVYDAGILTEGGTFTVVLNDGSAYPLEPLVTDPLSSLGFGRIQAKGLPVLSFAVESDLRIGQRVHGLSTDRLLGAPTMMTAYISGIQVLSDAARGLTESSDAFTRSLQLSTPSADGANRIFIDESGNLVAVTLGSGTTSTIFSVTNIRSALRSYLAHESVERPALGVNGLDLTVTVGLTESDTNGRTNGFLLVDHAPSNTLAVVPKGPAEVAGLRAGDIVTQINDQQLDAAHPLSQVVQSLSVGETVTVQFLRAGAVQRAEVTLGNAQ